MMRLRFLALFLLLAPALAPAHAETVVVGSKRFTESELLKRQEPGFNNSYALAMREDDAARLGIATISDLAKTKEPLRFGLSHEFWCVFGYVAARHMAEAGARVDTKQLEHA